MDHYWTNMTLNIGQYWFIISGQHQFAKWMDATSPRYRFKYRTDVAPTQHQHKLGPRTSNRPNQLRSKHKATWRESLYKINKAIAMMRRKSTPSENIYFKQTKINYQANISKLGRGKGFIPFFFSYKWDRNVLWLHGTIT